ncbi:MCE family protein [Gordonia sp. (in: high G+C Gram-positive bacteria)]|uniref:MCE family protein n=1 Tax=Gordonia sp. (in: high G+C Gram-positive bacteria) TaxID=84139 RepID=UPI0016A95D30|nr:MCE family protein [Gordonia sp. (in: high G+C Gram-positive bacteria)]NLG46600.1 MCE family protein [Gordonia sp. (in: high G+C Gram-positive bacteria)]
MKQRFGRSFNGNRRLWYGIFGVLGIVVVLVAVVGLSSAGLGKRTYTADFEQAGGIRSGDKVRVAGIDVGEVTGTELAGDHVTVTMKVNSDIQVKDDGSAEIKMSTLLGQRYVDVVIGDSSKDAPDDRIQHTFVPYDLQKTLEKGTPILAGIEADDLTNSIRSLNQQLAGAPAIMGPTLEALTQMSDVLNNRHDQITQLLKDTEAVTDQVVDSQFQLSIIVGQGAQLANKIVAREQLVTRMLDGVAALTDQARAVAAENQGQFAPVMANLNTISNGLEKNRENLRKLLEVLPVTARLTTNLMADGPYANGYLPWGLFPDNWLCLARVVDGC